MHRLISLFCDKSLYFLVHIMVIITNIFFPNIGADIFGLEKEHIEYMNDIMSLRKENKELKSINAENRVLCTQYRQKYKHLKAKYTVLMYRPPVKGGPGYIKCRLRQIGNYDMKK